MARRFEFNEGGASKFWEVEGSGGGSPAAGATPKGATKAAPPADEKLAAVQKMVLGGRCRASRSAWRSG